MWNTIGIHNQVEKFRSVSIEVKKVSRSFQVGYKFQCNIDFETIPTSTLQNTCSISTKTKNTKCNTRKKWVIALVTYWHPRHMLLLSKWLTFISNFISSSKWFKNLFSFRSWNHSRPLISIKAYKKFSSISTTMPLPWNSFPKEFWIVYCPTHNLS